MLWASSIQRRHYRRNTTVSRGKSPKDLQQGLQRAPNCNTNLTGKRAIIDCMVNPVKILVSLLHEQQTFWYNLRQIPE